MHNITHLLSDDHRACDALLAAVEHAVVKADWSLAKRRFAGFQAAMLTHFGVEETILFPRFEQRIGSAMGPTQVMRGEHGQMRQLMTGAESAVAAGDADDYAGHAETLLIMMQQHNIKEENVLYPMCDRQLADQFATLLPMLSEQITSRQTKAE